MKNQGNRLVYSTGQGRLCPGCEQPVDQCRCKSGNAVARGDGVVRVRREVAGRKGKAVTVVQGLPMDGLELLAMAKELKKLCGSGGTLKDGIIELQGEHLDKVMAHLAARGHTVKRSGG